MVFALPAMALEHPVRFIDQALSFGNAFPQSLLALFDLTSMALPLFGSLFLTAAH